MSYGQCQKCGNYLSLEEFNAQIELGSHMCFSCTGHALAVEHQRIKKWIVDIMDRREYTECWFVDDEGNHGDCGNWPTCNPHCTLREMMDHVGIAPQEDGGLDKQPVEAKLKEIER